MSHPSRFALRILSYISGRLYDLCKRYKKARFIEKLNRGEIDRIEWMYGDIPTQCDLCLKALENGFITGWDESVFRIMCPNCFKTFEGWLREATKYNLNNLIVVKDEDTPEQREEAKKIRETMGWG